MLEIEEAHASDLDRGPRPYVLHRVADALEIGEQDYALTNLLLA
jgi:hypothetical protein